MRDTTCAVDELSQAWVFGARQHS